MEELDIYKYDYCTYYYKKGTFQHHREDGPAMEYSNGGKFYFKNGKRHRLDGPAREFEELKEWFIEGERLSPEKEKLLNIWYENKKKGNA